MKEKENTLKKIIKGPSMGYTDVFRNRQTWEEIAKELKGEFKVHLTSGNTLESHTLAIPFNKWIILLSLSDTRPLKITVDFGSHSDFEMVLGWEDFTDKILKKLGKQDILLGWEPFDKKYLISSNKPEVFKAIFSREVQQQFLAYNICSLSFQPDPGNNRAVMISVIQRFPAEKDRILKLIDLIKLIINNFEHLKIIG